MKKIIIPVAIVVLHLIEINAVNAQNETVGDTTYLAIMMGGGISLGSYEAGVLVELMKELTYYNNNNNDHKYVIDLLVGASAGSITLM